MRESCHLKDCGEEAVVGRTDRWGPEYKVAMCENHVMERIGHLRDLERQLAEARGKLEAIDKWHQDFHGWDDGVDWWRLDAILGEKGV